MNKQTLKLMGVLVLIVCAGILAFQIGTRMSDEALMTIVGVMCGVVASIPVSIGLLIALTRGPGVSVYDNAEEPADTTYPVQTPAPVYVTEFMRISDPRVRQYIIATGTVPENSATNVWQRELNGEPCVFWRNSQSSEIHYAPMRQIVAHTGSDA